MKLQLRAEDWTVNMGLVGLKRLFDKEAETTRVGLELDIKLLDELVDRYFDYLLNAYSVSAREKDIMENALKRAERRPEQYIDAYKKIIDQMQKQTKSAARYFADLEEFQQMEHIVQQAKKLKNKDNFSELSKLIDTFLSFLAMNPIHDKLTLNFVKSVILQPLYGQVSFLNVTHNAKSIEEQKNIMKKDYIEPVLFECQWLDLLDSNEVDVPDVLNFLKERESYSPFKTWHRQLKKKKQMSEVRSFIQKEVPECFLIDGQLGTGNFEEMTFLPLGTSLKGSLNFQWNLNRNRPMPLSALGKLILFLVPIGASVYNRKIGYGSQAEYLSHYGFIHFQGHFENIYRQNNAYNTHRKNDHPFEFIIMDLLRESQEKSEQKQRSFMLIEFHSNRDAKKVLLDYYHMPTYVVDYFQHYGNALRFIHRAEYREEFVRSVLHGIDPKQVLLKYFREIIESNMDGFRGRMAVLERYRLLLLRKGVKEMKDKEKIVYHAFYKGQTLRKKIIKAGEERADQAGAENTAGGKKKIQGIAYRLLNAVKAGHPQHFLDTVFRLHMGVGLDIPRVLLNVLHEKEADFETVGSSFISGLLSDEDQKEKDITNDQSKKGEVV